MYDLGCDFEVSVVLVAIVCNCDLIGTICVVYVIGIGLGLQ